MKQDLGRFFLLGGWIAIAVALPGAFASDPTSPSNEITAVSSKVFNGYKRGTLSDGSFQPEKYGFAVGGELSRISAGLEEPPPPATADSTIDGISFAAIARTIEGPLAAQKYVPTGEPRAADLLIVVFWGRTIGSNAFDGTLMGHRDGGDRDAINAQNAKLLGFFSERVFDQGYDDPANMMSNIRKQLYSGTIDAIEDDRYFVILQAFDFQAVWKRRNVKLLWETRFSLSQRHHDFGKDLQGMAQVAAPYFGQDSHGLIRRSVPEGHVDIGDVKSLGPLPEK
jgi:hypothetical protein